MCELVVDFGFGDGENTQSGERITVICTLVGMCQQVLLTVHAYPLWTYSYQ